jgi:N-alpha-acetyltransferase 15/16, NatA auxiliary subunit
LLTAIDGDEFAQKLEQRIKPSLKKGVPALHSTLRPLYNNPLKVQRIESLLRSYVESLTSTGKFPGESTAAPPSAIMWTMIVLAHHLNNVNKFSDAIQVVNQGIAHTPTALELYMCKAKIYKVQQHCKKSPSIASSSSSTHLVHHHHHHQSAGDIERAAYEMNQVRKLDLADRFLNTKATKYFLRADKLAEAEEIVTLFTKVCMADPSHTM